MNVEEAVVGEDFSGEFLVDEFQVNKTQRGALFASLSLRDKTGEIKAVVWDYVREHDKFLTLGKVIYASGIVGEFNGAKQLKIDIFRPSTQNAMNFARSSQFDLDELYGKVEKVIESFEDDSIVALSRELLNHPIVTAFKKCPAATGVHNNWVGGLLEHVWSMIQIAEPIIAHYKKSYAPYLKRDHVLFGVIFHDIGKVIEYDCSNPAFTRTDRGHLVNHIVVGPAWIHEKGIKAGVPARVKMELMHLVSSHHGCNDWGSPVKPVTLEALLLHHIDNLDSKFMHAWDLMESVEECQNGLTKRSWVEGTRFISQREEYDEWVQGTFTKSDGSVEYRKDIADTATEPSESEDSTEPAEPNGNSGHDKANAKSVESSPLW